MVPEEYNIIAPTGVLEVVAALREGGENARVLAGGQSLIPALLLHPDTPYTLVDLRNVQELYQLNQRDSGVDFGAMLTLQWLSTDPGTQKYCPLLAECASTIGNSNVREHSTFGGSLAYADPAADLSAAVIALDATIVTSKREIFSHSFFTGPFTNALDRDEIITAIRIPVRSGLAGAGSAYIKIPQSSSPYALVGCAAVVEIAEDGICNAISLAITGAASSPFRLSAVENALKGSKLSASDVQDALLSINEPKIGWISDSSGSAEERKQFTAVAAVRAIETARSRIRA